MRYERAQQQPTSSRLPVSKTDIATGFAASIAIGITSAALLTWALTPSTLMDGWDLKESADFASFAEYGYWFYLGKVKYNSALGRESRNCDIQDITNEYDVQLAKKILEDLDLEVATFKVAVDSDCCKDRGKEKCRVTTIALLINASGEGLCACEPQMAALGFVLQDYFDALTKDWTEDDMIHGRIDFSDGKCFRYVYGTRDRVVRMVKNKKVVMALPRAVLDKNGEVDVRAARGHRMHVHWSPKDVPIEFGSTDEAS